METGDEALGAVMDRLKCSPFLEKLTGTAHLTQRDAVSTINPEGARRTREAERTSATRVEGSDAA